MTLSRFSHLCLHKPPLKTMGHRHSAALSCSPNLLLPTAQSTPGVLPSDAEFTRELSWHNYPQPCSADNAIICQQMSWVVLVWGCLDHTRQNRVVTFVPSNQTQTIEFSITQKGGAQFSLAFLSTYWNSDRNHRGSRKYLKTKCLCPMSAAKKSCTCFVEALGNQL